jgi:hypothetical protein
MAVSTTAPMAQAPMAQAKQFEKTKPIAGLWLEIRSTKSETRNLCIHEKKIENKANLG